jgi:hypothetical protein
MNMNRARIVAAAVALALSAAAVSAHGNKKHIIGTVEKVNSTSIVVKTAGGKSVEVQLVPSTTYVQHTGNQDRPAKLSDLHAGDRVAIHATPSGESLSADEVKFSPSSVEPKS